MPAGHIQLGQRRCALEHILVVGDVACCGCPISSAAYGGEVRVVLEHRFERRRSVVEEHVFAHDSLKRGVVLEPCLWIRNLDAASRRFCTGVIAHELHGPDDVEDRLIACQLWRGQRTPRLAILARSVACLSHRAVAIRTVIADGQLVGVAIVNPPDALVLEAAAKDVGPFVHSRQVVGRVAGIRLRQLRGAVVPVTFSRLLAFPTAVIRRAACQRVIETRALELGLGACRYAEQLAIAIEHVRNIGFRHIPAGKVQVLQFAAIGEHVGQIHAVAVRADFPASKRCLVL